METNVEAIVRPVRSDLEALTSESREIVGAAGERVVARLREMGETPPGAALITPAGSLDAGFLVHVVLQAPDQPVSTAVVRQGLTNAMRRAQEWSIASIAVPPLGTGAGQLDAEAAAQVMGPVLLEHVDQGSVERVEVVVPSAYELDVFQAVVSS